MAKWKIYNEDAVEWAKTYEKAKFHALLCDPPYHLTSIVKRFGKNGSAPAKYGTDGVYARASAGFMGQQWDGGDVAFQPETWAAFAQVLHPGAFIMAFSSSRSWHRLATAIEDAGYIIHPSIFLWAQGQGFPKATRIDTQIQPASEMKVVGSKLGRPGYSLTDAENQGNTLGWSKSKRSGKKETEILEPTNEMAKAWVGHRYGLQALKPAVEPIIVAQLPYDGRPIENVVRTGAGALNVDRGRISTQDEKISNHSRSANAARSKGIYGDSKEQETYQTSGQTLGRWPSNFILDETTAPVLDAQTGDRAGCKPHYVKASQETKDWSKEKGWGSIAAPDKFAGYDDSGGASRFFYTVSSALDESDPVYYCAKVSNKERNAGLDDKNPHPTLKPLDLCKYLATLLLPPDNYAPRRILIPFSGSGSEMIGAGLAGWEQIVGVEFDTENGYTDIAKARLEHWLK